MQFPVKIITFQSETHKHTHFVWKDVGRLKEWPDFMNVYNSYIRLTPVKQHTDLCKYYFCISTQQALLLFRTH